MPVRTTSALALSFLTAASLHAQFGVADIQYWVGSGQDTAILVVDFQDGAAAPAFAWGYLHDGGTAADMLSAVVAADSDLDVSLVSGFLNDLTYGSHAGLGGEPDYWSTWTGTSIADMAMNDGLTEPLVNGLWFGCSYTDFDPALPPTEPVAAPAPTFTADDVDFWVGTGDNSAILVIDFLDGAAVSSYAWGFRFNGTTTGEAMLNAIDAADADLATVWSGGFLSDITYNDHAGIGGSPDYWGTWSATDIATWTSNLGAATAVNDGEFFGCSYMNFDPMIAPGPPTAAAMPTAITEAEHGELNIFPQPATDILHVNTGLATRSIQVYDLTGKRVSEIPFGTGTRSIDVSAWSAGLYVLRAGAVQRTIVVQ
ncbi:MAG: T9SS type A sorting domain-containing protein [Flavobacteriales bacterium]|nr:T9SS type A sorting domain-containing protein [Flavobacteriales bacterium]